MKRLFLLLLVMALAVLLIPPLRQRAQPRIDAFQSWAGARLEGPLEPALTPYREIKAKSEMSRAVNQLVAYRNRGMPAPKASEFQEFLLRRDLTKTGNDPWGSPYVMTQTADSVGIVSAGADQAYDTDDDIVLKIRYPHDTSRSVRRRSH